jgi:ubiquinone/menaquinone biosynthesis C-methylase UbiE
MGILDKPAVRRLYDREAEHYDASLFWFGLVGLKSWRAALISGLRLAPGATVVDLCCGTGANFALLADAVGPHGRMVGVDLSEAMLVQARRKAEVAGWSNVELIQADVEAFQLPIGTEAVISTFGLEMVPRYEHVIENIAANLRPGGRLGLLGLKHPERWPRWLIDVGVRLTQKYGVAREYESFQPWRAAEHYLRVTHWEQKLFGAAYICIAEKSAAESSPS